MYLFVYILPSKKLLKLIILMKKGVINVWVISFVDWLLSSTKNTPSEIDKRRVLINRVWKYGSTLKTKLKLK